MKNNYSYQINRGCLWFAKGEIISTQKMYEYFTANAVKSLLKEGFISILTIPKIEP